MTPFTIYVAASYRQLHGVQLLYAVLRRVCPMIEILDWTQHATPPAGLSSAERKTWMDSDREGEPTFRFCRDASASADLVIYLGESGQDAGVEVGIAHGAGVEVIGLSGPLESPGLMLNGTVSAWAENVSQLTELVAARIKAKQALDGESCADCDNLYCGSLYGGRE